MDDDTKTDAKTILDAGAASQAVHTSDDHLFAITPEGYEVKVLDHMLEFPPAKTGAWRFGDIQSFVRYVRQHSTPGTIILMPPLDISAKAILDSHSKENAGWGHHVAIFSPTLSAQWIAWNNAKSQWLSQHAIAQFLEERAVDVIDPDAATFKQMALELEARKEVNFKSAMRLENGDVKLNYQTVTTAKAGEMEVPTEFTIAIPPHVGGPIYHFEAFLRYRLEEGKISFKFDFKAMQEVTEQIRADIRKTISDETDFEPFNGGQA